MRGAVLSLLAGLCLAAPALGCNVPFGTNALPGSEVVAQGQSTQVPTVHDPGASIAGAWYMSPTDIYGHGIMGSVQDGRTLVAFSRASKNDCGLLLVSAGDDHVFEDTAPRITDVDGDGKAEIITVRSHLNKGAQLAIYGDPGDGASLKLIAATPYIGTRNRWLAPIGGGADLDGDGYIELAYIDRPHLAKTLRVWRFKDGALQPVANLAGLTNHRIGEEDIGGGIRDCGQGPEMITASANWRNVMATRLENGALSTRALGPHTGRASLNEALACR